MAVNPVGYVEVYDYGIPQTFNATAVAAVSGGWAVYCGSQAAPVSSGASSLGDSELWLGGQASGTNYPVGIAKQNAGSTTTIPVVTRAVMLMLADAGISPGDAVGMINGGGCVAPIGSTTVVYDTLSRKIGIALTAAGSTDYCVVNINI